MARQIVTAEDYPSQGLSKWNANDAELYSGVRDVSATQTIDAATDAIDPTSGVAVIRGTVALGVTLTSAPTIADGVDGKELTVLNVGAEAVTLQDQGTLAGSNLRLTAATVVLGPRDSVKLLYSAAVGDWVQVSPVTTVL